MMLFCDPETDDFQIEHELLESEIAGLVDDFELWNRLRIDCEMACKRAYKLETGLDWDVQSIGSCEFEIEPEAAPAPNTSVGFVRCVGTAVEYACE